MPKELSHKIKITVLGLTIATTLLVVTLYLFTAVAKENLAKKATEFTALIMYIHKSKCELKSTSPARNVLSPTTEAASYAYLKGVTPPSQGRVRNNPR